MALSIWPCCDDEASISTEISGTVYTTKIPCDTHERTHVCSPFFHCGTCQTFVVTPAASKIPQALTIQKNTSFPEISPFSVILFPGDIWQPPQLG